MKMVYKSALLVTLLACTVFASELKSLIEEKMPGLKIKVSPSPYSRTIERIYIGFDENGQARSGLAHREIESYKPLTGVVIVDKTADGYVLREALFPDIDKIKNPKDRQQVNGLLKSFRDVSFDPHAEKSAVDVVSGATRYTLKTAGYFNYMARKIALEMEADPDWPDQE